MKKIILRVLLTLVIALLLFVLKTLYEAGVFKSIEPHFAGTEKVVKILGGAEDITINQTSGIAYISADDRRSTQTPAPVKGTIYYLDVSNPKAQPIDMLPGFKVDFHPHGISYFKTLSGKELLFVVNHTQKHTAHSVERFEIKGQKLVHLETIQDTKMTSPNDLVAIGERQFYVTNDHRYLKGFSQTMEDYLKLPLSFVNFYDGKSMHIAAKGFAYVNGINTSLDGKKVFITATTGRKLHVFDRDSKNKLSKVESIRLGTGADNIALDAKGNLWIGCHPKLLAFVGHSKNAEKKSPSQVLKVNYKGTGDYKIDEVYLNNGASLSGSSVAAVYKDNLLVGGVFDKQFLWCKRK